MARNNQQVQPAINKMAARFGYSPQEMLGIAKIESSLNPNSRTGSYKGLFQLSNEEFKRFGPKGGNIFNAEHNAMAAGALFNANDKTFQRKTGMEPNGQDRYLMHQQGVAGYMAHLKNPDRPAAENFAKASKWSTAKAEKAIWGNMTPEMRAQFPGGVKTVKSSDFKGHWENRTAQFGIGPGPKGSAFSSAETARAVALQKAEDKRFEGIPLTGKPRLAGTGPNDTELLDLRQTTLGDVAQRRTEADRRLAEGEARSAPGAYGITPQERAAAEAAMGLAPQGGATGITQRSVPVQTTAPETGAGRFAAPGLSDSIVPQHVPSTMEGLIPGVSQPSLPVPSEAARVFGESQAAPPQSQFTIPDRPAIWESMPQGLQNPEEAPQGAAQAVSPQGAPKAPVFSSSPPARSEAPQTQFDGWPDWAVKAFQMEPTGAPQSALGGLPGAIPLTTNWMSNFPTFGSLFQSSPGGGFGGFAPVNLGGS